MGIGFTFPVAGAADAEMRDMTVILLDADEKVLSIITEGTNFISGCRTATENEATYGAKCVVCTRNQVEEWQARMRKEGWLCHEASWQRGSQ